MIMKPESILIVVCALCVGFSVVARANDSDKEGREVKETATPAVPVASEEKPDEAKQAAWEEKEVETFTWEKLDYVDKIKAAFAL